MKYFYVKDGKVEWQSDRELVKLPSEKSVQEMIKDMTPEQLEAFKKERYEKFLRPLLEHNIENIQELRNQITNNPPSPKKVLWQKSWQIDAKDRNK